MNKISFDKCILCEAPLNISTPPEHVIPHYLGGRLKEVMLCDDCNHNISAKLYSQIKFDYYVRSASYILRQKIPTIYKSIENQQTYKTISPMGTELKAKRRGSKLEVVGQRKDNWIVLPTPQAIKYLESRLIKKYLQDPHKAKIEAEKISKTPNNKLERIADEYSIIRWDADKFQLDLRSNAILNDQAIALIAYEYLSLLLGKSIYNPIFDHVREFIIRGTLSKYITVNLFTSKVPQPFHLIFPEFESDKTRINIHLFEHIIAKVELINIHISNSPDFCYLEDLVKKTSYGALTVIEGKNNKWNQFDD